MPYFATFAEVPTKLQEAMRISHRKEKMSLPRQPYRLLTVMVRWQDGIYTVEGAIQTPASIEEVWGVLTDYEGLSDVFSNIKKSSVASRHPEIVLHQALFSTSTPLSGQGPSVDLDAIVLQSVLSSMRILREAT